MIFYFLKNAENKLEFLCAFHPDFTPPIIKQKFDLKNYTDKSTAPVSRAALESRFKINGPGNYQQMDEDTFKFKQIKPYDYLSPDNTLTKREKIIAFLNGSDHGTKTTTLTLDYVHISSMDKAEDLIATLAPLPTESCPWRLSDSHIEKIAPGSSQINYFLEPKEIATLFNIFKKLIRKDNQLNEEILNDILEYTGPAGVKIELASPSEEQGLFAELDRLSAEEKRALKKYVVEPTYAAGKLVKTILSRTLGFRWFIDLSSDWAEYGREVEIPTLFLDRDDHSLSTGIHIYSINAFNFWAIGLDIVASNTGKITGWLLPSPYSVPAYLAIKFEYGIRTYLNKRNLVSEIRYGDKEQLVATWLQYDYNGPRINYEAYISMQIAKHIEAHDFLAAILTRINLISPSNFDDRKKKIENYIQTRMGLLQTRGPDDLEYKMLQELKFISDELISRDPASICTIGNRLLEECKPDLAIHFLSKVRPDQKGYDDAMSKCAHYFRVQGESNPAEEKINPKEPFCFDNASYFANRAGDTALSGSLRTVLSVSLNSSGTTPNKSLHQRFVQKIADGFNYSYSQLAGTHGLLASVDEKQPLSIKNHQDKELKKHRM